MEKVKNTWSKKQTYEKVLSIIGTTCAISIIILAPIQILGIWNTAINIVEPMLGVLMLTQTIQNWKKNKGTAILSLLATILIFLFFTLNVVQTPPFNIRFAVQFIPEIIVKIFVGVFAIIIAYGYLKCLKWGYWSMIIYSLLFGFISLTQVSKYGSQPYIGNAIYSAIVVIYTIFHSQYLLQIKKIPNQS